MNIKPIGERILIIPKKEETQTKSGIYIPESAKEEKKEGEVVALGKLKEGEFEVKPGDKILYGGYSSDDFEFDGQKYIVIEYKDVLAKLE